MANRRSTSLSCITCSRSEKIPLPCRTIDNPLSLFKTTLAKLKASGYVRISQTPYVNIHGTGKKRKSIRNPTRCPHTLDFLEERTDSERPAPIMPNLFS